jgi:hypothetical protein
MSGQASRHSLKIRLACYNAAGRHQHRDRPWRDVRAAYSPPPQAKREESLHRRFDEPLKGPAATRADFDPDGAVMLS